MASRFSRFATLLTSVSLAACGGGGSGGEAACDGEDLPTQGSCLVEGACWETRGSAEAAEAGQGECDAYGGVWSSAPCDPSFTTGGGCVYPDAGMALVAFEPGATEADCLASEGCWAEADDDGGDGTGGTGAGASCTTPDPGATLAGSCTYAEAAVCLEVRGEFEPGADAIVAGGCASEGGTWAPAACPDAGNGACVSGIEGVTYRYVFPGRLWSEVWAACEDLDPCSSYQG